jgi:hypothetical protein
MSRIPSEFADPRPADHSAAFSAVLREHPGDEEEEEDDEKDDEADEDDGNSDGYSE